MHSSLRILRLLFALASLGALPVAASAYPERPVTIVVPFAPGGANDVVMRAIQQPLAEALGQPIVIENRGGAGGSVGAGYVARARPDGYTLLMAATGFVVNPSLYDKVQYDPLADFEQVAEIATFPVIYMVRPDMGVNTLQEFIAYAKARPGLLNYSTPGAGTLPHLAAALLKLNTGIEMVHIPYAGAAPAAQALLSKTVEVASISITVAKPQIGVGAMKGLAVTGSERWPARRYLAGHPGPDRHPEGGCRAPRHHPDRSHAPPGCARAPLERRFLFDRARRRGFPSTHRRRAAEVEDRHPESPHHRPVTRASRDSTCSV